MGDSSILYLILGVVGGALVSFVAINIVTSRRKQPDESRTAILQQKVEVLSQEVNYHAEINKRLEARLAMILNEGEKK